MSVNQGEQEQYAPFDRHIRVATSSLSSLHKWMKPRDKRAVLEKSETQPPGRAERRLSPLVLEPELL